MIKTFFALFAMCAFLWIPSGRAAKPDTVSGNWHFVLDTEDGSREFDAAFEQNAEKITGKCSPSGDEVAGTFMEKKLALEFAAHSEEVGAGTMKIDGKLADDGTLSGTWSFQDYSGMFKAVRAKDAPAK